MIVRKSVLFRIDSQVVKELLEYYEEHPANDKDPYIYVKPEYFMRGLEKLDDDELARLEVWATVELEGRMLMDEEFALEKAIEHATSANDDPVPNKPNGGVI